MNDLIDSFLVATADILTGGQLRGAQRRRLDPLRHNGSGSGGSSGNSGSSGSGSGSVNASGSSNGGSSSSSNGGSGYDYDIYGNDGSKYYTTQSDMSTANSGTNGNSNGWSASTSHPGRAWLLATLLGVAILACCLAYLMMRNRRKREIEDSKTLPSELDDEDSYGNIQQEFDQMEDPKEPDDIDPNRWQSLEDINGEDTYVEPPPVQDAQTTDIEHTGGAKHGVKAKAKGLFSKVKSKLRRHKS